MRATASERLLAKRQVVGDCWLFDGAHDRNGYGRFFYEGVNEAAHRVAWIIFRGDPGDLHVLHNEDCGHRDCFNPSHLHLGTHQQNMLERDQWGHGIRGERAGRARLAATDVLAARAMRTAGSTWKTIGEKFGVAPATVRQAATGRTWAHLQKGASN